MGAHGGVQQAIEDAIAAMKEKIETQASLDEDLAEFIEAVSAPPCGVFDGGACLTGQRVGWRGKWRAGKQ